MNTQPTTQQPKVITCLTKEHFWNVLYEKYPDKMKNFCQWIDEYKKDVKWAMLFNSSGDANIYAKSAMAPKYHDLPIAMQVGIFMEYTMSSGHRYELFEDLPGEGITGMANRIAAWFAAEAAFAGSEIPEEEEEKVPAMDMEEVPTLAAYLPDNFAIN